MQHEFISSSTDDLDEIAQHMLLLFESKRIVAIYGAMGAGKTTFTKRLCKAMGVVDTVSSPTFSLVNEYLGANGIPVYHFDFYRIQNLEEAMDIGPEEYFDSGSYCLVEWPELIEPLLPATCVKILITHEDAYRRFTLEL